MNNCLSLFINYGIYFSSNYSLDFLNPNQFDFFLNYWLNFFFYKGFDLFCNNWLNLLMSNGLDFFMNYMSFFIISYILYRLSFIFIWGYIYTPVAPIIIFNCSQILFYLFSKSVHDLIAFLNFSFSLFFLFFFLYCFLHHLILIFFFFLLFFF